MADFVFELSDDGSYYIFNGVGEALCGISNLVVPATYKGKPVKEIADFAICSCADLQWLTLPAELDRLDGFFASECRKLVDICIVGSSSEQEKGYFSKDGNVYERLSDGGTRLVRYAPGKTADSFTAPDDVVSIGSFAFSGCTALSRVSLPSVEHIGGEAFDHCTGLEKVILSHKIDCVSQGAFNGCASLRAIIIDTTRSPDDKCITSFSPL